MLATWKCILFSLKAFFWASKPTVLPFRMSVRARFKLRCEANTQVHLLSPSEMSRTSAWTCWDTRGRSSVQLSSSGPIWCRGRWRCEIHPSERSVPRISVVLTFLCLLGLVSEAFLPAEHLKSQNRGRESTFPVPLLNPAPQHEGTKKKPDLLPVSQDNEQRRDAPPGAAVQVKVRSGSCCGEGGRLFDVFHLDFTLLLSAFFALHPCDPTSAPSRPSPSLPVIYRSPPPPRLRKQ